MKIGLRRAGADLLARSSGYKCTKNLTRVVLLPDKNGGYWSDQGYEWYGDV